MSEESPIDSRQLTWVEFGHISAVATLSLLLLLPSYMLDHPYWLDEAWVAVGDRAPFSQLALTSGSTPIGWKFLMTILPDWGDQHQRLLPLTFSVGTVVAAYMLARDVLGSRATRTGAASFAAIAVAVAPVALLRQDLKQYTGDAFVALVVLWLAVRLEQSWSSRRLWTLVIVSAISSLVSYTSMFVVASVMFSQVVVNLARRRYERLIQWLVAAAVTAAVFLAVAVFVVVPSVSDQLTEYWTSFYLDGEAGIRSLTRQVWNRLDELSPLLGFRSTLLFGLLTATGLIGMARRGYLAAAVAVPVLWLEMVIMGVLGKYPFLDQRTSHFLLLLTVAVAGIGVGSLITSLSRRSATLGAGVLLLALSLSFLQSSPFVGSRSIPDEDVRTQTYYVEEHINPGDVVLVNGAGRWGFAYYWPEQPVFYPTNRYPSGFGVRVDRDDVLMMEGGSSTEIEEAFGLAFDMASDLDSTGRIWLVRTHVNPSQSKSWNSVLDRSDLSTQMVTEGPEPLTLVTIRTD